MSPPDLIVCGSLTIDNVVTADGTRLPRAPGGNVVYAALGAALWGGKIGLVSRAGADYPADFLAMLAGRGLDLGGIARTPAAHGMNVAFAYSADGSRVRAFPPDVMDRIPAADRARFTDYTTHGPAHRYATWLAFAPDAADIPRAWLASAAAAHFAAMPVQRHLALAGRLRDTEPRRHIQLDSPWHDGRAPAQDFATPLLRAIDLLLPSEADVTAWRPNRPPIESAIALARSARRAVVLKRGGAGSLLIPADGSAPTVVPAIPVTAVDPTGAGDAFCGGVLAGMRRHGELGRAVIDGTVSASFAVEAVGLAGLLAATTARADERAAWLAHQLTSPQPVES
jgi:ribokinase